MIITLLADIFYTVGILGTMVRIWITVLVGF